MSDLNAQKSLVEAAMQVRLNQIQEETVEETVEEVVEETPEVQEEVVEETTGTEELVYEYLSSFFGADLNESIDELTEEQLEEAIVAVNTLADAVNEYFELDEVSLGKKIKRAAQTVVGSVVPGHAEKRNDFKPLTALNKLQYTPKDRMKKAKIDRARNKRFRDAVAGRDED